MEITVKFTIDLSDEVIKQLPYDFSEMFDDAINEFVIDVCDDMRDCDGFDMEYAIENVKKDA